LFVNQAFGIAVDQASEPLPQLADLGLERWLLRPLGPAGGLHTATGFLGEALRMGEQGTDFLPDRKV
jgi:hypothetical protein